MKKNKSILITAGLIVFMAGAMILGNQIFQGHAEQTVHASASNQLKADQAGEQTGQNTLSESQQISLNMAEDILKNFPDMALLDEYAEKPGYGDSSLELMITDVNAMSSATAYKVKELICQLCKDQGLDVKTAKVRDLTAEQIAEIDQRAYEFSDHPKD